VTDAVRVRPAAQSELDELAEIHACAYPEPGGYVRHARHITHNAFGGLELVRVAEKNGHVVGLAALYAFDVWLGGRRVPAGGIGTLAVAPEARRAGVARALLDALHAEMAADGRAMALLYPFQQRFYGRLGYGALSPLVSLEIAIDTVSVLAPTDGAFSTVRLEGPFVEEARALYEAVAARTAGRVARTESRWMRLFAREERHWIGVVCAGRLEGYVSFSYEGGPLSRDQSFVVHEMTARDFSATRALFAACAAQRDQIADVVLTVPYGDPLVHAFEDAAGPRRGPDDAQPLGTLAAGPMVRILDLGRALTARGYAADGEVTFASTDGAFDPVRLSVRDGAARVESSTASADVELASPTLASMVAAGLRPAEAAELGLVRARPAALQLAEQMFAGPRFQCLDPF
jgi:predicted acetyltransferase